MLAPGCIFPCRSYNYHFQGFKSWRYISNTEVECKCLPKFYEYLLIPVILQLSNLISSDYQYGISYRNQTELSYRTHTLRTTAKQYRITDLKLGVGYSIRIRIEHLHQRSTGVYYFGGNCPSTNVLRGEYSSPIYVVTAESGIF